MALFYPRYTYIFTMENRNPGLLGTKPCLDHSKHRSCHSNFPATACIWAMQTCGPLVALVYFLGSTLFLVYAEVFRRYLVEKDKRTVPRHVTQVNSIDLSILVRSNRDFDAIKWSPKIKVSPFFGLKSSTSGPWTFTQFFVGIRYFCVYIFCIFFLSLFCSTNIFVVLGALDFYTHLFVRSGYYFLDIASSHWQWVRLIGTPEWLEMILLVKIGTSQHHGSCRVRFTLPKAPLSNYIPLHPITSHYRMVIYHCCSHCHY